MPHYLFSLFPVEPKRLHTEFPGTHVVLTRRKDDLFNTNNIAVLWAFRGSCRANLCDLFGYELGWQNPNPTHFSCSQTTAPGSCSSDTESDSTHDLSTGEKGSQPCPLQGFPEPKWSGGHYLLWRAAHTLNTAQVVAKCTQWGYVCMYVWAIKSHLIYGKPSKELSRQVI